MSIVSSSGARQLVEGPLAGLRLGMDGLGRSIGDVVSAQARISIERGGAIAESVTAQRLLDATPRARTMADALAAEAAERVGPGSIKRLILADTPEALTLNHLAATIDADPTVVVAADSTPRELRDYASQLRILTQKLDGTQGIFHRGDILLSADQSHSFVRFAAGTSGADDAARGTRLAYILTHETHHAAHRPSADPAELLWYEAVTDLAARTPGSVERLADRMGLPVMRMGDESWWRLDGGYRNRVVVLRALLELAGTDTFTRSRVGRDALANSVVGLDPAAAATELAERIGRRYALDDGAVGRIAADIPSLTPGGLREFLHSHRLPDPGIEAMRGPVRS